MEEQVTFEEAVKAKETLLKYLRSPDYFPADEMGEQELL